MKMKYKYARLCWNNGDFAIVKDCKFEKLSNPNNFNVSIRAQATFLFGSRRGYDTSGKEFRFSNVEKIEELDKDFVVKNFFPGLI